MVVFGALVSGGSVVGLVFGDFGEGGSVTGVVFGGLVITSSGGGALSLGGLVLLSSKSFKSFFRNFH